MAARYQRIRWIFGDQLNENHSWFKTEDTQTLYVLAELKQELCHTKHHGHKICAFFAAMENFAKHLADKGHHVLYLDLDATAPYSDLIALVSEICLRYGAKILQYQRPDEYRLLEQLRKIPASSTLEIAESDTEHFLLPFEEISDYFDKAKSQRMEMFYRKMRKRFSILMVNGEPTGGRWNFDAENRKKLKSSDIETIPEPLLFSNDVSHICRRLEKHEIKHLGSLKNSNNWPINRKESLTLLDHFCRFCLPCFGKFQDALTGRSPFSWSLYHSRLSFSLNAKLITPLEVIEKAIRSYESSDAIDIAQVEGFVRQILGWREFVRGVYWANMPEYAEKNYFHATADLPKFFWNSETKMQCLHQSLKESLEYSYAHHIQRLMVIGNFCLLTGINPDQVDDWYLGIYIDGIEWAEMPNTRGMALHADGGILGSKPYAAGGNYINKMSDYCSDCHYSVKLSSGDNACPMNSLYWNFMVKHQDALRGNHRIQMIYKSWERMPASKQQSMLNQAKQYLADLNSL